MRVWSFLSRARTWSRQSPAVAWKDHDIAPADEDRELLGLQRSRRADHPRDHEKVVRIFLHLRPLAAADDIFERQRMQGEFGAETFDQLDVAQAVHVDPKARMPIPRTVDLVEADILFFQNVARAEGDDVDDGRCGVGIRDQLTRRGTGGGSAARAEPLLLRAPRKRFPLLGSELVGGSFGPTHSSFRSINPAGVWTGSTTAGPTIAGKRP